MTKKNKRSVTQQKNAQPKSRAKPKAKPKSPVSASVRINKLLASAGLGSRRQVEELVLQGRVEVDGRVTTDLATRVDLQQSKITIDGELLKQPKLVYYALNKPKGVLSTNHDPTGRQRVIDFVPDRHRVFSVGRLDQYSEGLMLLTNDGTLAQRLAHPKFRVQKTYFVVVAGALTREELDKLRKGVYLAEGVARIDGATIRKVRKTSTELEIKLSEGKNREIRRILARAGHKVVLLRRIAIGPLRLGELPVGAVRELTSSEVRALYERASGTGQRVAKERAKATTKSSPQGETKTKAVAEQPNKPTPAFSTPIEHPVTDDFGLGLEDEYQYDESTILVAGDEPNFPFDESGDEWDDDFAFDVVNRKVTGTVLEFDETERRKPNRKPREPNRKSRKSGKLETAKRHSAKSQAPKKARRVSEGKSPTRSTKTAGPKSAGKFPRSNKAKVAKPQRNSRPSSPSRSGKPNANRGPKKRSR